VSDPATPDLPTERYRVSLTTYANTSIEVEAPTRDQLVGQMLAAFEPGEPWTIGQVGAAARTVMALWPAEPAPPLDTATTVPLITGGQPDHSMVTFVLPVPPGTAVEVREAP